MGLERELVMEAEATAHLASIGVGPTDDSSKYDAEAETAATVKAIFNGGGFQDEAELGQTVGVVLDASSFYSESGGQVTDTGSLEGAHNGLSVLSVKSYGGFVLHTGTVTGSSLKVGDQLSCCVDYARRAKISPNHTCTHLLNFALRQVLGAGTDQKGSIVTEDKLRFDFNAKKALKPAQVAEVERIVCAQIAEQRPVFSKVVPLAAARSISSLRAVFGETYPDPVRVVCVGAEVDTVVADPENAEWGGLSVELCGGTHMTNLNQAGDFRVIEEGAIAKGVRRITAVTGAAARRSIAEGAAMEARVAQVEALPDSPDLVAQEKLVVQELASAQIPVPLKAELNRRCTDVTNRVKAFKKRAAAAMLEEATAAATATAAAAAEQAFLVVPLQMGCDGKVGRTVLAAMQGAAPSTSILVVSFDADSGRVAVFASCPGQQLAANKWTAATIAAVGGKGGGKPNFSQAQAKDVAAGAVDVLVGAATQFALQALSAEE